MRCGIRSSPSEFLNLIDFTALSMFAWVILAELLNNHNNIEMRLHYLLTYFLYFLQFFTDVNIKLLRNLIQAQQLVLATIQIMDFNLSAN